MVSSKDGFNEVDKLQYLSLVSKVCRELDNHIGVNDRDVAEFIIDLAKRSKSPAKFGRSLSKNGTELDDAFVESLYVVVQRMMPKTRSEKAKILVQNVVHNSSRPLSSKESAFPGLSKPNTAPIELSNDDISVTAASIETPSTKISSASTTPFIHPDRQRRNDQTDTRQENRRRKEESSEDDKRDSRRSRKSRWRSRSPESSSRHTRNHNEHRRNTRPNSHGRKLVPYEIYEGEIQKIMDFGAFVQLYGLAEKVDGLVHISQVLAGERVLNIKDVLTRNQKVKVKCLSVIGTKVALSMKDVDQQTGEDLNPERRLDRPAGGLSVSGTTDLRGNPFKNDSSTKTVAGGHATKHLNPTEIFEIDKLIAAGVMKVEEHPNWHPEHGIVHEADEDEREFDVEMNESEPAFLRGQTSQTINLSPVKVIKNPDGSMHRAALTQAVLSKERQEVKSQQRAEAADSVPADLHRNWEDPMAESGSRLFAAELRGLGSGAAAASHLPEWKQEMLKTNLALGKVSENTLQEQRASLPIAKLRAQLLKAFVDNQLLVVIGETGSGKTTQMTQYLAEEGYCSRGRIACTQPRRVAAMSVAKRVAEEVGCQVGQEVGYCIRFEDCTSRDTKIKYMTDGMLLRECLLDPDLKQYSVVILDEAHERTINTDVLFGLLKQCARRRRDLKIIITSATLDAEKFSDYFNQCPIFTIPGRLFPVTVMYANEPESDYLDSALLTVIQIHLSEPEGDILLFLTGKEEIDTACQILFERMNRLGKAAPPLLVLPVYSALPSEMQTRIFEPAPPGQRKCVIGTNIAEASLTIDGIYYVVDPGFVKVKVYNAKMGMDSLVITPISQASARQRAGRAGRTGPGKCYRLYTEAAYRNEMLPTSVPELQRTNLGSVVLTLKALGINDLINFDFMDKPPLQAMISAMENLYALGALDDEGLMTRLGRKMAEFPLVPQLAKVLIASVDFGCSDDVLTIVAMLTVENIFFRPKEKQAIADQKRAKFFQAEGDHLTLLEVYNAWKRSRYSNMWCHDNYIQARSMKRAQDVRKQLLSIMDRYSLSVSSCGRNFDLIRKAICSGFFTNAAKKDPQEGYKTLVEGQPVFIHPSSALFNRKPDMCLYHNLVMTSKEYMREVLTIEAKWLPELAPRFYRPADPTKLSKRKRREKIEPLFDRYAVDPNAWRLSKRRG